MKLIKSSFEILEQSSGLEGIYEAIERAGRVCYKSERPEGKTAKSFVNMLIKREHLSPLEHGTVYLNLPPSAILEGIHLRYINNPYSKFIQNGLGACITTNMRVLHENDWLDDLKYLCEPTERHVKRVGVRVNCSIGISREANRHRKFSICEQSTRYCNYSKDKFNNELTFVIPSWVNLQEGVVDISGNPYTYGEEYYINGKEIEDPIFHEYLRHLSQSEDLYLQLIEYAYTPQQAREVLPLSTATEVIYTGFINDWQHFFELRTSILAGNKPHPDMAVLADGIYSEFMNRNYL